MGSGPVLSYNRPYGNYSGRCSTWKCKLYNIRRKKGGLLHIPIRKHLIAKTGISLAGTLTRKDLDLGAALFPIVSSFTPTLPLSLFFLLTPSSFTISTGPSSAALAIISADSRGLFLSPPHLPGHPCIKGKSTQYLSPSPTAGTNILPHFENLILVPRPPK